MILDVLDVKSRRRNNIPPPPSNVGSTFGTDFSICESPLRKKMEKYKTFLSGWVFLFCFSGLGLERCEIYSELTTEAPDRRQ